MNTHGDWSAQHQSASPRILRLVSVALFVAAFLVYALSPNFDTGDAKYSMVLS